MRLKRIFWFLVMACSFSGGCSSPGKRAPSGHASHRDDQLKTLETIAALEKEVAAFAEAYEEVRSARAYVRSGSAIVLLSPRGGATVKRTTVDSINRYITESTGLNKSQIIMKIVMPQASGKGDAR